jgi:hypothetical protein
MTLSAANQSRRFKILSEEGNLISISIPITATGFDNRPNKTTHLDPTPEGLWIQRGQTSATAVIRVIRRKPDIGRRLDNGS